jgi:D-tyrosyl-tRNA(Tyr) deacylase
LEASVIGLLQRVASASVTVDGDRIAMIGRGLMVLVGVQRHDASAQADRLLTRLLDYRVFEDADRKMNLSLRDVGGDLLLVPQFTLAADTRKGRRPSFSIAAPPDQGSELFDYLVGRARAEFGRVEAGCFGADMQVQLCNDGPVTFWLES